MVANEHLWLFFLQIILLDMTLIPMDHVESFEAALNLQFGPSTYWPPFKSTIWR